MPPVAAISFEDSDSRGIREPECYWRSALPTESLINTVILIVPKGRASEATADVSVNEYSNSYLLEVLGRF